MGEALTRVFRKGVLEAEGFPVADVSEYLDEADTVVWVDFCGPSVDQLHELAAELDLHELAVEDALGRHQRPKLDRYASHLFLTSYAIHVDTESARLDETEVDAFISKQWLITVRKNDQFPIEPVLQRWDRSPDLAVHGVGFLLYGLLDVIVSTIIETNLSLRDYRQNLIVKKVSSWAAIIAVPALVTGYYGMNVPYPGSGATWGVVASTLLMAVACIVLYRVFRRRDWL